jgi:hypothetical protein
MTKQATARVLSSSSAAVDAGVTIESLQTIAANVQTAPVERPVKDDPRKLATLRETIAYVLSSKRITDKSPANVAYKCAQALNKAGVAAEKAGEHVWTRQATLEEIGRLTKAGLLK